MDIATESTSALRALRERFGDWILLDEGDLERYRTDWGRWTFRTPGAVARPRTTEQVAELVRWCRDNGVTITPRAQGHSQSGQSTNEGGVVLDITAMDAIHSIDRESALTEPSRSGGSVARNTATRRLRASLHIVSIAASARLAPRSPSAEMSLTPSSSSTASGFSFLIVRTKRDAPSAACSPPTP